MHHKSSDIVSINDIDTASPVSSSSPDWAVAGKNDGE